MATIEFIKIDHNIDSFDCGNSSISLQLQDAGVKSSLKSVYTYEIKSGSTILGYYSIVLRRIKPEELPNDIQTVDFGNTYSLFAVELKLLAIDKKYQGKGIGTRVLSVIINSIRELSVSLPIRFIFIDALSDKSAWYTKFEFIPLRGIDNDYPTVPMILDIISENEKNRLEEYFSV